MGPSGSYGFLARLGRTISEVFLYRGAQFAAWVAGVGIIVLMLVSVISVLGRRIQFFAGPWLFSIKEISELTMSVLVGFSIAFCWYLGGHVRIGIIRDTRSPRVRGVMDVAATCCGIIWLIAVAWSFLQLIPTSLELGIMTIIAEIPKAPFQIIFLIMVIHFVFVLLRSMIGFAIRASGRSIQHDGYY